MTYAAEDGAGTPVVMGWDGIGGGGTLAAGIEQSHDCDGITWPVAGAPYHVVIIPVNDREQELVDTANKLYDEISAAGLEAVLDDRGERAGVKFKDADLIGYPARITVGAKSLARGCVEVKIRKTGEMQEIPVGDVTAWLKDFVRKSLANG